MEKLGAINCYVKGNRQTHTICLAVGTTPFMCKFGNSQGYVLRPAIQMCLVEIGWYRPCREEFDKLPEWEREHVLNGGLLYAPLAEATARQLPDDPVKVEWEGEEWRAWARLYYGRDR